MEGKERKVVIYVRIKIKIECLNERKSSFFFSLQELYSPLILQISHDKIISLIQRNTEEYSNHLALSHLYMGICSLVSKVQFCAQGSSPHTFPNKWLCLKISNARASKIPKGKLLSCLLALIIKKLLLILNLDLLL